MPHFRLQTAVAHAMAIGIGQISRICTTSRELYVQLYSCSDLQATLENICSMMSLAAHAYMTTYTPAGNRSLHSHLIKTNFSLAGNGSQQAPCPHAFSQIDWSGSRHQLVCQPCTAQPNQCWLH